MRHHIVPLDIGFEDLKQREHWVQSVDTSIFQLNNNPSNISQGENNL